MKSLVKPTPFLYVGALAPENAPDSGSKKMSEIYADGTYLAKNANWHQEHSQYKSELVFKALTRTSTTFNTCVDVGCGAGLVAERVAEIYPGATVSGYDISPDAQQFWNHRKLVHFHKENLFDTDKRFDLALCLDVFEHVEDYFGFLRSLRSHASRVVFNIPLDMNVAKLITGLKSAREEVGHLHYFNSYTAIATLKDSGYSIVDSFFSAGFMAVRPVNLKQAMVAVPRWGLAALGGRVASTLAGGYSLVVTADS